MDEQNPLTSPVTDTSTKTIPARLWLLSVIERFGPTPLRFGCKLGLLVWLLAFGLLGLQQALAVEPRFSVEMAAILILINGFAVAYIHTGLVLVLLRAVDDLKGLRPLIALSNTAFEELLAGLVQPLSRRELTTVILGSVSLWTIANLSGWLYSDVTSSWQASMMWSFPLFAAFWSAVWLSLVLIVRLAREFARVGREHLLVDLMAVRALAPLAQSGGRVVLFIVGGLSLIPLQALLTGRLDLGGALPALLVALPAAAYVFIRPLWGVHQAIVQVKAQELARITAALGYSPQRSLDEITSDHFDRLLRYRDQVRKASEWPLTSSDVLGVTLYVVIPPLAWIGAALVERLLETLL